MKQVFFKSIIILSVFFVSCSEDDTVVLGDYESGVFVINEGNFGDGDGSISYFNKNGGNTEQTVFKSINGGKLGDVVQSATFSDGLIFVVINNSNRVEVVNAYTFESVYSITDVVLPRYAAVSEGKGYLTEWVSFSDAGRVTIFDVATGSIDSRVTVGFGAEDIVVENGKAYVSNSFGNTISIIDLSDNSVEEIEVSASPKQMEIDATGNLWVACAGGFDANFSPANDGALHKVNLSSNEIETTYELNTNYAAKLAMSMERTNIYFYVGNNVFEQNVSTSSISSEPFIVNETAISIYGIGIDPNTGMMYLGDSKAFLEDGEVFQYNASGELMTTFPSGRAPNGFVFN
ncbi:MAG: YncE family protein [Ekhidna sp.]